MANPVCNSTVWVDQAACYVGNEIPPNVQLALLIYGKVLELAALGGTSYLTTKHTTLITNAVQAVCAITPDRIKAARIAIQFANATTVGAAVPATINLKMAQIACLQNTPVATLELVNLFLDCSLGYHAAFPQ